jgi:cell division protein FtsQ
MLGIWFALARQGRSNDIEPMEKKKKIKGIGRIRSIARNLLLVLIFIGLVVGILALRNPRFFPIRKVIVESSFQHINQEIFRDIIKPHIKKSFFILSLNELKTALLQLPWVFEVTIHRIWPDKLRISIREQEIAAGWNSDALFNPKGENFIPPKMPLPINWPLLTGSDDQMTIVWQRYLETNKSLYHMGFKVIKMDLSPSQDLKILLNNGVLMILANNDFANSINNFIKAYPALTKNKSKSIESIDFRYSNGFAVKWK